MAAARTSSWLPLIVRLQQELDQCVSQKSTVILGKKFLPESVDLYLFRASLDVFLDDTPGEKPRLQWAVNWGKETKAERKWDFTLCLKFSWSCEKQTYSFWMHKLLAMTIFHRPCTREDWRAGVLRSQYFLLVKGCKSSLGKTALQYSCKAEGAAWYFIQQLLENHIFFPVQINGEGVGLQTHWVLQSAPFPLTLKLTGLWAGSLLPGEGRSLSHQQQSGVEKAAVVCQHPRFCWFNNGNRYLHCAVILADKCGIGWAAEREQKDAEASVPFANCRAGQEGWNGEVLMLH